MKTILALMMLSASSAFAMPRSWMMSCSQLRSDVRRAGELVVRTSPTTYQRVVIAANGCGFGEVLHPLWVVTQDQAACFVGYSCQQDNSN